LEGGNGWLSTGKYLSGLQKVVVSTTQLLPSAASFLLEDVYPLFTFDIRYSPLFSPFLELLEKKFQEHLRENIKEKA